MRLSTSSIVSKTAEQQDLLREIQLLFLEKLSTRIESAESDLFQTGILDSMTLVQLVLELEERFGLRLPMEDLELDSFRSVMRIAELVARHKWATAGEAS